VAKTSEPRSMASNDSFHAHFNETIRRRVESTLADLLDDRVKRNPCWRFGSEKQEFRLRFGRAM
jgi:hypothetical protein